MKNDAKLQWICKKLILASLYFVGVRFCNCDPHGLRDWVCEVCGLSVRMMMDRKHKSEAQILRQRVLV